jgi:hypothetical protein
VAAVVTFAYGCIGFLAVSVGCGVLVLALDRWDGLAARRARRVRQVDEVEQAYADNGFAVDVEPAPATDELPPVDERAVNGLLVEIYRAQTRARFKGIYGEDGQP